MAKHLHTDDKIVYCVCPGCGMRRSKENGEFTIVLRGKERNGIARFLCKACGKWFNEKSGSAMRWYER
jgi:transposase-like protein